MAEELKIALKTLLIDTLNLEDTRPEDIADDAPLFDDGLGLDSLDGLELVLQLEKTYGIKIGSSEASKDALRSINVLAEYISEQTASPS